MIKDTKLKSVEPLHLTKDIEFGIESIVSRTLLEESSGTISLFAFDKGQSLSKHAAPFDAGVQVLEGKLELEIGDKTIRVSAGEMAIMPSNIPHAVKALEKTKMLLTMMKE